jgi:ABC-type transport system involved in cytochrome bd biosynthesis fused ATPase/permease subunit
MDALEGKTVILVTHQVEFLPAVDTILVTTFYSKNLILKA